MTTDNTPELDEIIDDAYEGEVSWTHDQLDGTSVLDDNLKDIDERKDETRQALIDWHNKQVEAVLDRLVRNSTRYTPDGLVADGLDPWAISVSTIEAERKRINKTEKQ